MKKLVAAVMLSVACAASWASSLTVAGATAVSFSDYNGQPASVTGAYTSGQLGALVANSAGVFSATYLGQESGYDNSFKFLDLLGQKLTEADALGKTITMNVNAGALGFKFSDSMGVDVTNGVAAPAWASFAILNGKCINSYGCFDYILGFNDSYTGDADYDDFVVGVKLSPVPLPAAVWLFGSALLGFVTLSNRRKV